MSYSRGISSLLSPLLPLPHRRRGSPLGIVLLRGWKPVLRDRRTRPADFAAPALSSAFLLINFLPSQRRIKVEKNWNEISFLPMFPRSNGRGSTLAIHVGGEKLARKEGRKEEVAKLVRSNAEMKNRPVERRVEERLRGRRIRVPKSPRDVLATRFRVVVEERERKRGRGCRYAIPRRHHRPV